MHRRKELPSRSLEATADIELPEKPLEAIFDDKTNRTRVTGPIEYAIDGKEETAWGTDAGPGRRNQPRKAVFTAEKPIANPGGTLLTFYLSQKHGGWNSDDNQSHNLGRFRLSITRSPDAVADPLPQTVREILAMPAAQRTPAQVKAVFQLLADHGSRVSGSQCSNRTAVAEAPAGFLTVGTACAGRNARHPYADSR